MPMSAANVMIPVPPTPGIRILNGAFSGRGSGKGSADEKFADNAVASGLRNLAPRTVTKLGQNPFKHEKSLLQFD